MWRVRFFFFFFFFQLSYDYLLVHRRVDSVGATIFTFPVVIQLNVFIAVTDQFVFWKSKIFLLQVSTWRRQLMRLSSTHVMKMTLKQSKQSQKAFRRQNLQYSHKICLRLTVFVLNQVHVFVSGAYRHTQHAQTWLFIKKKNSEERIIISTLDKYCASSL